MKKDRNKKKRLDTDLSIVQEALANAGKHSGARRVLVRLACEPSLLRLLVEDDGRGFDFSGRLSQAELKAGFLGPGVRPAVERRARRFVGGEGLRTSRLRYHLPLIEEASAVWIDTGSSAWFRLQNGEME